MAEAERLQHAADLPIARGADIIDDANGLRLEDNEDCDNDCAGGLLLQECGKLAIVSTVRGVESTIASFLRWHAHVGFDAIYLYFDEPDDDERSIEIASSYPCVYVMRADAGFRVREAYDTLPSYDSLREHMQVQVQARQRLNCEHCVRRLATPHGVRWLLHIDSDEVLLPADGQESVRAHFTALEAAGCWQFHFCNLEAVPQQLETKDPFRSVSLFKQSLGQLGADIQKAGTPLRDALEYWLKRSYARLAVPIYFLTYDNGKAAVRLDGTDSDRDGDCASSSSISCGGVHGWRRSGVVCDVGCHTNIRERARRFNMTYCAEAPRVLHYACCSLDAFVSKDWRGLGYMDETGTFGAKPAFVARWSRMQKDGRSADSNAEEFRSVVGLFDAGETRRQLASGLLMRIDCVARFLTCVHDECD